MSVPIYTKTGDKGDTALFGGARVPKCHELVDAYGSLDELNSWVGLLCTQLGDDETVRNFLYDIQADLLTIGSTLAGWDGDLSGLPKRVKKMEALIDTMTDSLPELRNFILPGGSVQAANVHLARAVCRRVERQIVALRADQPVDAKVVQYLNRLSDLLFVLARFINKKLNIDDVTWSGIDQ